MASKSKNLLALDIGQNALRLLQYNQKTQMVDLVAINPVERNPDDDPSGLEGDLQQLLKQGNVKAKDVITCVSGQHVVCKTIVVEGVEPDRKSVLEWEIGQQLLGSLEEYRLDFQEITTTESVASDDRRFLTVACRNAYVDRLVRLLHRVGLRPVLMDVDLFALQNAFEMNYPDAVSSAGLLLGADGGRVQAVLCKQGMIHGFEVFFVPESHRGENLAAWLWERLEVFFKDPAAEKEMAPLGIWVSAEAQDGPALKEGLASLAGEIPVESLMPFQHLGIREDLLSQLGDHVSSCAIAAGMILRGIEG